MRSASVGRNSSVLLQKKKGAEKKKSILELFKEELKR